MKNLAFLFLVFSWLNTSAQLKATDIKTIQFFSGNFQFDGKLGSYKVKGHRLKPLNVDPKVLVTDSTMLIASETAGACKVTLKVAPDVRYYGGGEQFSHVELTGKHVPFLVEENGIGRGDQPATRTANLVGAGGH